VYAMLLLSAMLGCRSQPGTGPDYFTEWSCDYQPWDWYMDPVQALLEADDSGAFDFAPPGALVTGQTGSYDYGTGDIAWSNAYLDGYSGVSSDISGYGTVYDSGDLDLLLRRVFTDVLDATTTSRVRMQREGCSATVQTWEIAADDDIDVVPADDPTGWQVDIVSDDRVESHVEWEDGGTSWVGDRVQTSDLVTTATTSASDGSVTMEQTMSDDGTGTGHQESVSDDFRSIFDIDYRLDGSVAVDLEGYTMPDDSLYQECSYELSYAGDGVGTCTFYLDSGTLQCNLSFDDTACTLDCGSAGTFDC